MYQSRNPQLIESQQLSDTSDIDVNLLSYDIDELDTPYNSNRSIFVHTDSNESNLYLAQPRDKVKKTWYNQMSKSELNVDPKFATDNTCYEMEATLQNIASNVIQATYLGPLEKQLCHTNSFSKSRKFSSITITLRFATYHSYRYRMP